MKKMVFSVLLTLIGLVFSVICLLDAIVNPCIYNGVGGLLGGLLGEKILLPFILSVVVMCAGLALCGWEAFRKEQ